MKFNYLTIKKVIFLIILGFFSSNFCLGILPSNSIRERNSQRRNSPNTRRPISKKRRFNLQELLFLNEIENIPKKEFFEASIPHIKPFFKQQIREILDKSRNEIIELFNGNMFFINHIDDFIEKSKNTFCDDKLLNSLINHGKLDLSDGSIPTFMVYLENTNIDIFNSNRDECEIIDQTIFDEIFLKKIIVYIFAKTIPLIELNLYNNGLIEIPTHISELKDLKKLDLTDNQITDDIARQADSIIKKMPNLSYLSLRHMDYDHEEFPQTLGHLSRVENDSIYLNKEEMIKNKLIRKIKESKYEIFHILKQKLNPIFPDTNILYQIQPALKLETIINELTEKILRDVNDFLLINNWLNGYKKVPKNTLEQIYKNVAGDFYLLHQKKIMELDKQITDYLTNIIDETLSEYLNSGGYNE
ncbi:MAG: hypothetical protein ABIA74_02525 [bacterium]